MLNHKANFARVSITFDTDCTLNVNTSPTEVLSFHRNALLYHAGKGELDLSANPPCKVGNVFSLNGAYVALILVAVSCLVVGKFKIYMILHCIRVLVLLNFQYNQWHLTARPLGDELVEDCSFASALAIEIFQFFH